MQRGWGPRAAEAAPAGMARRFGRIAVVLAGLVVRFRSSSALAARQIRASESKDHQQLYDSSAPLNPKLAIAFRLTVCASFGFGALALSACMGAGQLENLAATGRRAVAIESVEGAPQDVVHRFVAMLNEEAAARQIAVVAPSEAGYRLRGYLATDAAAATVSWAWDVYGADRKRAVRLSGAEEAAGRMWEQADDRILRGIARAGGDQLAAFLAATRPASAPALAASPPPRGASPPGWLDDWAPEASGIFRL